MIRIAAQRTALPRRCLVRLGAGRLFAGALLGRGRAAVAARDPALLDELGRGWGAMTQCYCVTILPRCMAPGRFAPCELAL